MGKIFKKNKKQNIDNDEIQKNIEISEIEEKLLKKEVRLEEIGIEIQNRKKKLSKIKSLIESEKKKLQEMKQKRKNKNNEFQNLMLKIWEKKEKYKDIIDEDSSNKKREIVNGNSHLDKIELKYLFREMESYIDNAYVYSSDVYKTRIDSIKDIDSVTEEFFRTKGRIDNYIIIFQYLIFFGRDVEYPILDIEPLKNHYQQFKDAMIEFFKLIDENDVKIAIYREMIKDPSNVIKKKEDFDLRIEKMQKMIRKRIVKTDQISIKNLFELFNIFREFVLFWFEIKNYKVEKIRKSDIYTYYLLKHLLSLSNLETDVKRG